MTRMCGGKTMPVRLYHKLPPALPGAASKTSMRMALPLPTTSRLRSSLTALRLATNAHAPPHHHQRATARPGAASAPSAPKASL